MTQFQLPDEPSEKTMVEMDMRYLEHLRTESYKQGQRDALEAAAKICDAQVDKANRHACKSKSRKADDIYSAVAQTAHTSRIEIRKLMEGI